MVTHFRAHDDAFVAAHRLPIEAKSLEDVCEVLGGRMHSNGQKFTARCPAHDDRSPSLSGSIGRNGKILLYCHGRCDYKDIVAAAGLRLLSPVRRSAVTDNSDESERRRRRVEERWEQAESITRGDPVWRYLENRRIEFPENVLSLRYEPRLQYYDDGKILGTYDAMIGRIQGPTGELVAVHQTYLTSDGQKADVPVVKKWRTVRDGATVGGAIKLFIPTQLELGVAEGIETALACHMATGMPMYACASAGLMEQLIVPCFVKKVVIFADNDHSMTGLIAAKRLAKRLLAEGRTVQILVPPIKGDDWCDAITRDGSEYV
jgi:putative DNA primase/helicase